MNAIEQVNFQSQPKQSEHPRANWGRSTDHLLKNHMEQLLGYEPDDIIKEKPRLHHPAAAANTPMACPPLTTCLWSTGGAPLAALIKDVPDHTKPGSARWSAVCRWPELARAIGAGAPWAAQIATKVEMRLLHAM
jgi:hypothetical protein